MSIRHLIYMRASREMSKGKFKRWAAVLSEGAHSTTTSSEQIVLKTVGGDI